jgi:hypothetical protein
MKELVFALEFKGRAEPVAGAEGKIRAKTSASSQLLRSIVKPDGLRATVEAADGGSATFESEVQITGERTFVESGSIAYGEAGHVSFKTVGQGMLGPSPVGGLQRGAVIWEVTKGEGRFAGAQGLITSNFTVGAEGEVTDNHFARLFLPS